VIWLRAGNDRRCDRKLLGDNADLCGITELGEELFAVFPSEAEGADVGDADLATTSRMVGR
jgi:hypothetical protein